MKLIFFLLFFQSLIGKVLIITHAYNQPDFIEYHCKTFQKFLLDDFEYVVFNDAKPGENYNKIREMCAKWKVRCIDIPQWMHEHPQEDPHWAETGEGTRRHVDGIHFSLDTLAFQHRGIVCFCDSDLFSLTTFKFRKTV